MNAKSCNTLIKAILTLIFMGCLAASLSGQPSPSASRPASATTPSAAKLPTQIEVDVPALVQGNGLMPATINDPVWDIKAAVGQRLVALPILVAPAEVSYDLTNMTLHLQGGSFVGWAIDPPAVPEAPAGGANRAAPPPETVLPPSAPPRLYDPNTPGAGGAAAAGNPAANYSAEKPRITRALTIAPDGSVSWHLDSSILGATVKEGDNAYSLHIHPELMAKFGPLGPPSITSTPGEAAKDYQARRKAAMDEYLPKAAILADIRKHVNALETKFTQARPQRVWAVFNLRLSSEDFVFDGPSPLPWNITLTQTIALRNLVNATNPNGPGAPPSGPRFTPPDAGDGTPTPAAPERKPTPQMLASAQILADLIKAPANPISLRLVAEAISRSGALPLAQPGDAVDQLTQGIIGGSDEWARTRIIRELAGITPPTPETIELLRAVAKDANPATQLLALSGLLHSDPSNEAQFSEVLATVNRLLADPSGPAPEIMLTHLTTAVGANAQAVTRMGTGVKFAIAPGPRLDQAITAVLAHAASDPVSVRWLSTGLLAGDPAVAARTLELLSQMPDPTTQPAPVVPAAPDAPPMPGARQVTETRITIDSAQYPLLSLLRSADPTTQALAWRALPRFLIGARLPTAPSAPGEPAPADLYTLITDAGLNQTATPTPLVDFLRHQADVQQIVGQLARVVVYGKGPATDDAAKAIVGGHMALGAVFPQLTPDARQTLVASLYEAQSHTKTSVTSLARATEGPALQALNWLATQIQQGTLPPPAGWLQAMNGEDAVFPLVAGTDDKLAAGAIAALVAAAGGDEQMLPDVTGKLRVPNATAETIKTQWPKIRQEIYMQRLQAAAGPYRMTIRIYPAPAAAAPDSPASPSLRPPTLGPPTLGPPTLGPPTSTNTPAATPPAPTAVPNAGNTEDDELNRKADYQRRMALLERSGAPRVPTPAGSPTAAPPVPPERMPNPGAGAGPGAGAPAEPPAVDTIKAPTPEIDADAGVFQLIADGKAIYFASRTPAITVPETTFAIRVTNPVDFKNIADPKLSQVPWDKITGPLDLLPEADKSWVAHFVLPDGRTGEIRLTPASAASQPAPRPA